MCMRTISESWKRHYEDEKTDLRRHEHYMYGDAVKRMSTKRNVACRTWPSSVDFPCFPHLVRPKLLAASVRAAAALLVLVYYWVKPFRAYFVLNCHSCVAKQRSL